jgi:hypothetical protein
LDAVPALVLLLSMTLAIVSLVLIWFAISLLWKAFHSLSSLYGNPFL